MITKEQAMALRHGQELHFGVCKSVTGPRGGVKVTQTRVRVSGQCQTWKTRPEDFRVPVKHGLYQNGEIVPSNAASFHLESDCPLLRKNVLCKVCGTDHNIGPATHAFQPEPVQEVL